MLGPFFSFSYLLTGVTFKRFRHLSFAWKRILHTWWTSERNEYVLVHASLSLWFLFFFARMFVCVYVIVVLQSSTVWITVLRFDKQALCEVQVFFFLYFFGTSFLHVIRLKRERELKNGRLNSTRNKRMAYIITNQIFAIFDELNLRYSFRVVRFFLSFLNSLFHFALAYSFQFNRLLRNMSIF